MHTQMCKETNHLCFLKSEGKGEQTDLDQVGPVVGCGENAARLHTSSTATDIFSLVSVTLETST